MNAITPTGAKRVGTSVKRAESSGSKPAPNPVPKPVKAAKKTKRKKPAKGSSKKKQIGELQGELKSLCSKITSLRWGGKCAICSKAGTAAHHFFGAKACSSLRWVPDNLVWLCFYCHMIKNHRQGLTEPVRVALVEKIGAERFAELYSLAFKPQKVTIDSMLTLKKELSMQLEKLRRLRS